LLTVARRLIDPDNAYHGNRVWSETGPIS
jgi:hypothetical protein